MPTLSRKQKLVRFAYRNSFHPPATPALTFASSMTSSSGPITPPDISHRLPGPSPYTISYVPQFPLAGKPPLSQEPFRPHPLLESAAIRWDLMEDPSTITQNNYPLSSRVLVEQATNPRLPAFSLTSMHLPWPITVIASNGSYVTLEDFFESVYYSLRTNMSTNEFITLLPDPNNQKRTTLAYERRYRRFRSISARDMEKRGGMKRVDLLMGRTRFHSISNTSRRSEDWQLNIS